MSVSLVPVPSNPNALIEGVRAFAREVQESMKDEIRDAVRAFTGKQADAEVLGALEGMRTRLEAGDRAIGELAALRSETRERDVAAILEDGARAGKVTPANRDAFARACGAIEVELEGAKVLRGADPIRLRALVEALPVAVEIDGKGHETPPPAERAAESDPADEWAARVFGIPVETIRSMKAGG